MTFRSMLKQALDECDYIRAMLKDRAEDDAEDDLERRYKVVVTTLLPILFTRVSILFTTSCVFLGLALLFFIESLFKG